MADPATTYWASARQPRHAVTLALPLLLAYEGLLAVSHPGGAPVRNGAEALLTGVATLVAGGRGPMLLGGCLLAGGGVAVWRDLRRGGAFRGRWLALMLAEAAGWAAATGLVVGTLTAQVLGRAGLLAVGAQGLEAMGPADRLAMSLGAGLWEELVFRVLLVAGLRAAAGRLLGFGAAASTAVAVGGSALAFSAFHYVGALGDPYTLASFTYRALAGLWFTGVYVARGFGIAAWAHALYDVGVLLG